MMSITHAAIAAAGTSLILGTANPLALGLAVIGSQLPDLDTTHYNFNHWLALSLSVKSVFPLALGLRIGFPIEVLPIVY